MITKCAVIHIGDGLRVESQPDRSLRIYGYGSSVRVEPRQQTREFYAAILELGFFDLSKEEDND